jgi:hypothetical protein
MMRLDAVQYHKSSLLLRLYLCPFAESRIVMINITPLCSQDMGFEYRSNWFSQFFQATNGILLVP